MLLNHEQVAAFGEWLDRERIREALSAARPELAARIELDDARPLLRIRRPQGGSVLVARMRDAEAAPWAVGVSGPPAPRLHPVPSRDAAVRRVLEVLDAAD